MTAVSTLPNWTTQPAELKVKEADHDREQMWQGAGRKHLIGSLRSSKLNTEVQCHMFGTKQRIETTKEMLGLISRYL